MVRRLVEQQHVRGGGERAGERRARQLTAGEAVEAAVEVLLVEAQPARHRGRAVAPQVAAARLQPGLRARVTGEQRVVHLALPHAPLEVRELRLDRELLDAARQHVLAQRPSAIARRALVVEHDPRALREAQLAAVDRLLAREHPQQRRLAGAVAPGDRHARAAARA